MKRILKLVLGFILCFDIVNASTIIDSSFYGKVNNLVDGYVNNRLYLLNEEDISQIPYEYIAEPKYNPNYSNTGLLNLNEYLLAGTKKSYLYHPRTEWMMTTDGLYKTYAVTMNDKGYDSFDNSTHGEVTVTKFIKSNVKILGNGTYSNPWVFDEVDETSKYVVKHYLQGLDGNYSYLYRTDNLNANTYSYVTPSVLTLAGYTSPTASRVSVMPGNTTVVEYKYARKQYTLSLTASDGVKNYIVNGSKVGTTYSHTYYYGANVNINVEFNDGYSWVNWLFALGQPVSFVPTTQNNTISITTTNISLKAVGIFASRILSYKCANTTVGTAPFDMTFSGKCEKVTESGVNWRFRLLTNGNLSFKNTQPIDVFLVGGGGGGGNKGRKGCGGGGGGYTKTYKNITVSLGVSLPVVIGTGGRGGENDGDDSTAGTASKITINGATYVANGGGGGGLYGGAGGSGGSGWSSSNGDGWCNPVAGGSFGNSGSGRGGAGQGSTTCEFGEGTMSYCNSGYKEYGKGGYAGGAMSGCACTTGGTYKGTYYPSQANLGSGGYGNPVALDDREGCPGSTGVVVVRNKR